MADDTPFGSLAPSGTVIAASPAPEQDPSSLPPDVLQKIYAHLLGKSDPGTDAPSATPAPNLLEQARSQYPILKKYDYGYTENFRPNAGFLEHWDPGDVGVAPSSPQSLDALRPQELPLGKPGLEIRDPNTRPIDILGDIVSHHLVNTDPVVKGAYQKLQDSMTPEQQGVLQDQYKYAQDNEGETRPFEDWKNAAGMPGFFRGYAFQQWPKEFNDKVYTPQQKSDLDGLMGYLSAGKSK